MERKIIRITGLAGGPGDPKTRASFGNAVGMVTTKRMYDAVVSTTYVQKVTVADVGGDS